MNIARMAIGNIVGALLLSTAHAAPELARVAGHYRIAPASQIAFSVAQVAGGGLRGKIESFSGAFELDPGNISRSRVLIRLNPASVITGQKRSEDFLRSAAVFDVARYPVITFRSIRVIPEGPASAIIDGILTARGISHEEKFKASLLRKEADRVVFHVTGKVLRSPYGMDIGTPIYSNVVRFDMQLVGKRS